MSTTTHETDPPIKPPTPRPRDEEPDVQEPMLEVEAFAPDRPTIKVHTSPDDTQGTIVEIALMREFGIADQQRLTKDGEEYQRLWDKDSLTKKEGDRLKQVLDRMFDKVLYAPAKLKALIDDQQRASVVTAFTYAPFVIAEARERRKMAEAENPDKSQTSET